MQQKYQYRFKYIYVFCCVSIKKNNINIIKQLYGLLKQYIGMNKHGF